MIKTLKLIADTKDIPFQREYSAIFRFAYERYYENIIVTSKVDGKTIKQDTKIYALVAEMWRTDQELLAVAEPTWLVKGGNIRKIGGKLLKTNKELVDRINSREQKNIGSWMAWNAILDAKAQCKAHKSQEKTKQRTHKVVWGGKDVKKAYDAGNITKEAYKNFKLRPIVIQGQKQSESNRLFDFSRLCDGVLVFMPDKYTNIEINFTAGANQQVELAYLVDNIGKIPIQVQLKNGQVCLAFEQELAPAQKKIKDRIGGIDLNPNYIGFTIVDFKEGKEELVKTICFKFSNKTRRNDAKRRYETIQIAHAITKLANHYRCSEISLEELTMGAKNTGKGKNFNRLCNNQWNRTLFQWNIKKLGSKFGIEVKEVLAAYSSTIGNILHSDLPDPCAAAWEIARRAKFQFIEKLCMYPDTNFSQVPVLNLWKKQGIELDYDSWSGLHKQIKSAKLKYRTLLSDFNYAVQDFCSSTSGITVFSNFSLC